MLHAPDILHISQFLLPWSPLQQEKNMQVAMVDSTQSLGLTSFYFFFTRKLDFTLLFCPFLICSCLSYVVCPFDSFNIPMSFIFSFKDTCSPNPAGSPDSSLKVQLWSPSLSLAPDSDSSSSVLVSHFLFACVYYLTRARYFIEQVKKSGGKMVNHLICEIKQQKKRRLQKHLSGQGRWEGLCQREDSANRILLEIATGI